VNRGDLDYYLVRPVSSLFFLSLREFAANSFLNLVMATGILAWAILRWPAHPGAPAITGYVLLLMFGTVLHYVLYMLCLIPVFWMHTAGSLQELFHIFDRIMARPHRVFTGWARRLVVSVLPFALIASYPAAAFFEGFPAETLLHMLAVVVAAFVLMLGFWRLALRSYASASS
jgi:ABC-2 type transport system permease protein